MTVSELKGVLERMDDDAIVKICVQEPAGWICPDGATVDVDSVYMGFDWHQGDVLVVPKHKLDIHDVEAWSGRKTKPEAKKTERKDEEDPVESANRFIRTLEAAHEASKGSKLVFR